MTWEEFKKERESNNLYVHNQHYMKTNIECPNCGELIYKNVTMVLASYPPQYKYNCMECGWSGVTY